jgi:hypothetical protein
VVAPAKERWESAVEVRLSNRHDSVEDAVPDDEPRRLHAIRAGSLNPECGGAHLPLLPTFESWTTRAARPGVKFCDECVGLVPFQGWQIPDPHLRRPLLNSSGPQWIYTPSPIVRWLFLSTLLFAPWIVLMLRYRLIVEQEGLTIVKLRRRCLSWDEILRFSSEQGSRGGTVKLLPQAGEPIAIPVFPSGLNLSQYEAGCLADQLNKALLAGRTAGSGDQSQRLGRDDAVQAFGPVGGSGQASRPRDGWLNKQGGNIGTYAVCLLVMLVIFATLLSIEPNHHDPSCGGSNIVVALHGPQGAYANAAGTGGCQRAAILDVAGATLLLAPFIGLFVVALIARKRRRIAVSEDH